MAYTNQPPVSHHDYEQLKAVLEDTQSSLAAAFARVEAYRIRERLLTQEITKLRLGDEGQAQATATPQAAGSTAEGAAPSSNGAADAGAASSGAEASTSEITLPAYITPIQDHLPVILVSGGRKVGTFVRHIRMMMLHCVLWHAVR